MNHGIVHSQGFVGEASGEVRVQFIRRVYGLLLASLGVTTLVVFVVVQAGLAPMLLQAWPVLALVGFLIIIGLSYARRTSGLNLALFFLYGAIQGAIMGPLLQIVEHYAPGVSVQALWLTIGSFGGLTAYVFQTKRDFNFMGGFLFAALIALIVAGMVLFFFSTPFLSMLYSIAGVLLFAGFVLYDTSRIIHHLQPGEEIVGAIELYLDVMGMFRFLLSLLFGSRD